MCMLDGYKWIKHDDDCYDWYQGDDCYNTTSS